MKFAVGYQLSEPDEEPLVDVVRDYREGVAEIYFAWPGAASGRAALGRQRGAVDWSAQSRLEGDLRAFRDMGLRLDILFNASCYGARALSLEFRNEVGSTLERLEAVCGGADVVTTTSLTVARVVKEHFPDVEVRASVNMRIGTVEAMGHVADLFDSFYLQRDLQRNVALVREVGAWCEAHGRKLALLANSGCLRNCPGQAFHDNLVAHDAEIDERRNLEGWTPHVCRRALSRREGWPCILQSTWIRPEDVRRYEGLASIMKLATRMHARPRTVLHAYVQGLYRGNLLDLLEPGLGPLLAPRVIDNERFPADWFERTSTCSGRCHACGYCAGVLEQVLAGGPVA